MQVLFLTIFLSSLLAVGFVVFFIQLGSGERSDPSRDPLLPLRNDSGQPENFPSPEKGNCPDQVSMSYHQDSK